MLRVNEHEMWIVQHLVDLVEDWRFSKRLQMRKRCEDARRVQRVQSSASLMIG